MTRFHTWHSRTPFQHCFLNWFPGFDLARSRPVLFISALVLDPDSWPHLPLPAPCWIFGCLVPFVDIFPSVDLPACNLLSWNIHSAEYFTVGLTLPDSCVNCMSLSSYEQFYVFINKDYNWISAGLCCVWFQCQTHLLQLFFFIWSSWLLKVHSVHTRFCTSKKCLNCWPVLMQRRTPPVSVAQCSDRK